MPSHVIRTYVYDAKACALDITFVSGRRYRYHGVPPDEAQAMRAAFAKGAIFNRRIRDRYPATPLPPTPVGDGTDMTRAAELGTGPGFPKA